MSCAVFIVNHLVCPALLSSVQHGQGRREVFAVGALSLVGSSWGVGLIRPQASHALTPPGFKKDMSKFRRRTAVPEEDFLDLSNGIKYYDLTVGKGPGMVKHQKER